MTVENGRWPSPGLALVRWQIRCEMSQRCKTISLVERLAVKAKD